MGIWIYIYRYTYIYIYMGIALLALSLARCWSFAFTAISEGEFTPASSEGPMEQARCHLRRSGTLRPWETHLFESHGQAIVWINRKRPSVAVPGLGTSTRYNHKLAKIWERRLTSELRSCVDEAENGALCHVVIYQNLSSLLCWTFNLPR